MSCYALYYFIELLINVKIILDAFEKIKRDPEFETFYTKKILLNESICAWMVGQGQPHASNRNQTYGFSNC